MAHFGDCRFQIFLEKRQVGLPEGWINSAFAQQFLFQLLRFFGQIFRFNWRILWQILWQIFWQIFWQILCLL